MSRATPAASASPASFMLPGLILTELLRGTGTSIAEMRDETALVKQGKSMSPQGHKPPSADRVRVEQRIVERTMVLQLIDDKIDFYGEWVATCKCSCSTCNARLLVPAAALKRDAAGAQYIPPDDKERDHGASHRKQATDAAHLL